MNTNHIDVGTLFEHARLKRDLNASSQGHIAACDFCRDRLNWMKAMVDMGAEEPAFEPPLEVLESVLKLGRSDSPMKQFRNVIAGILKFDSFKDLAPAGVRRADVSSRQLTYEVDDLEVELWLQRSGERTVTLAGQILTKSGSPFGDTSTRADLIADGDHTMTSSVSPWGEFVFPDLSHGQYDLQIALSDRVLRFSSLPMIDDQ